MSDTVENTTVQPRAAATGPLVWDETGKKLYETGVSKGVLYVKDTAGAYGAGVAWNGMTSVNENPSGAEATPIYADNLKYLNLVSAEEFAATIEAYTYPDEFAECDGSAVVTEGVILGQQSRKGFGFCYRTEVGDDIVGTDRGYKLHLVYNCQAAPSGKTYQTINESPEAMTFSWEVTTTPAPAPKPYKPSATITVDSTKVPAEKMKALEDILYGKDAVAAKLPSIEEVITLLKAA